MEKNDAEISDLDVADLLQTEDEVKYFLQEALADAHPRFDTVMRVLNAMGLKLTITPCVAEKQAKYSAK